MIQPIHATAVARRDPAGWRGVLLTGPSGTGKSDVALRLIATGWRLVADDYADVWVSGDHLYAGAPTAIAGRIEARGLGIVDAPALAMSRIVLVANCVQAAPERMPEPVWEDILGVRVPRLDLDIRPASATATLGHAMDRL